jgi:ABC-2 type transport system permease protein
LALLPAPLAAIAQILPFRASMGFPLEMALDRLSVAEIAFGFLVTLLWISVFVILYRIGWRTGIKEYQAVGG